MADLLAQCPADSASKRSTKVDLSAADAFSPNVIRAPACTPIEITFTNVGAQFGFFNNVAIPYGTSEWIFQGDKATNGDPVVYLIPPLPAGTYRFLSQAKRSLSGTFEIGPG